VPLASGKNNIKLYFFFTNNLFNYYTVKYYKIFNNNNFRVIRFIIFILVLTIKLAKKISYLKILLGLARNKTIKNYILLKNKTNSKFDKHQNRFFL